MPQGRLGTKRAYSGEDEAFEPASARIPAQDIFGGTYVDMTQAQSEMRFDPSKPSRRFEPDAAAVVRGTPVGAAGIKSYHRFPDRMLFVVDDERKIVPLPNKTWSPRESAYQPYQRWHYQFHINPDWGRKNGRYPRFSFINLIANTGENEAKLRAQGQAIHGVQGQRPAPRFTKVLRYPRQDATPQTYGEEGTGGYGY